MVPISEEYKKKKVKINGERMTVAELEKLMRQMNMEDKLDQILVNQARDSERINAHGIWIRFLAGANSFLLSLVLYLHFGF